MYEYIQTSYFFGKFLDIILLSLAALQFCYL